MNPDTIRRYYVSYINMIKTAKYRGYKLPETIKTNFDFSLEEFTQVYGDLTIDNLKRGLSNIIFDTYEIPKKLDAPRMIIIWHLEHKMGLGIRDVVNKLEELNIKKAMIVVDGGITPGCREMLGNIRKTKCITIDIWTLQESMVYVPDHVLVPEHKICSITEKKQLLKSYGIKPQNAKTQLPIIRHDATIIKYLGAKKGQLIKIIRESETDPDSMIESFRIVV